MTPREAQDGSKIGSKMGSKMRSKMGSPRGPKVAIPLQSEAHFQKPGLAREREAR